MLFVHVNRLLFIDRTIEKYEMRLNSNSVKYVGSWAAQLNVVEPNLPPNLALGCGSILPDPPWWVPGFPFCDIFDN